MFDLNLWGWPRAQRKAMLAADRVAPQQMGHELAYIHSRLQSADNCLKLKTGFWRDYWRTFRRLITRIVLMRVVGTTALMSAIFASGRILRETNGMLLVTGIILAYFLFQSLEAICGAMARRLQQEAGLGIQTYFTALVNGKLLRLDRSRAHGFTVGNLKVLISSDAERVSNFLIALLWGVMPVLVALLILAPLIVLRMGSAGLVGLLTAFLPIPLMTWMGRFAARQESRIKTREDGLATIIGEWVSNVRLVRYMGWQDQFRRKTAWILRKFMVDSCIQHLIYIISFGLSFAWWLMPVILMLWTARAIGQPLILESVFSVIWMLNHLHGFVRFLPETILEYNAAAACIDRLQRFLGLPDFEAQFLADDPRRIPEESPPIKLHLEKVVFAYGSEVIIRGISTCVDLKGTTGIIGTVGSGKTTLLQLLAGDLKPDKGRIWVEFADGTRADLWHGNIHRRFRVFAGYVCQEPYLSNTSLAGNIALDDNWDVQQVMQNIYFAGLQADVNAFENGLDQEIGENGINLSGGQKQRVNLARAFYSGRRLTFLDDPLSAVDSETESLMLDQILANSGHFIMVSHRLGQLRRLDRLLVMEKGRIVQEGSPQELANGNGSPLTQYLKTEIV